MLEEKRKAGRPRLSQKNQAVLDDNMQQLDAFEDNAKSLTIDEMNKAKKEEVEPQTKLSQKELGKIGDIYLKPTKALPPGVNPKTLEREKFNEKFREQYNFAKEYVQFIAEHKEMIGENIEIWTKPFGGMNAEYWVVPTNKPVWGPRYLAEQITRKSFHRLKMEQETITGSDGLGTYHGGITVDTTVERLTAKPVTTKRSIFMGSHTF